MDDAVRFGDLVFDKSFLFARRGSSAELKFTRAERAMLLLLTANARKMVTRNRLLDAAGVPVADADIEAIVAGLKRAMWRQATTGQGVLAAPTDEPLELRMHEAARLFARSDESWAEMSDQLAAARRNHPNDPQTELMWAMHLYARILQNPADLDMRAAHEEDIERCVFDHLTAFQDNPIFLLGASKLLLFTGRGHLALAEPLAKQAFLSSTAFASAFAGLGQIQMCKGDIRSALDLYDRGIELSEPDSEFRVFLMVLKCAALMADGDRPGLDRAAAQLYTLKPVTRLQIGFFLAPPGSLAPDIALILSQFDASRARRAILHLNYVFARLFVREDHRENIMRGVISLLTTASAPTSYRMTSGDLSRALSEAGAAEWHGRKRGREASGRRAAASAR